MQIQRVTYTRDPDTNEALPTWATFARVWGRRQDAGGREFLRAGGIAAEERTLFHIPYRGDLTTSDRILCEGLTWNVQAFRELSGRRRYLEIQCQAYRGESDA